jgi:hypothetical protein
MHMNIDRNLLTNYKLNWIKRQLDVIMLDFESDQHDKKYIHIQCFFRIIHDGIVILASPDMYKSSAKVNDIEFDWTEPGTTLFDESLFANKNLFENFQVVELNIVGHDVEIRLSNNSIIEIIPDSVEKHEMYRIYDNTKDILII